MSEVSAPIPQPPLPFKFRRVSEIMPKPISWLWPGRFARGKVSLVAGHPGLGKSQLTIDMAATVSTGSTWPVDNSQCQKGSVIFISAEDDAEDTIRPRLEAAGADLEKISLLDGIEDEGEGPHTFNLANDIARLGEMISYLGDVALVVIDPITAYLGGADSHKNADIRALLSPLGELAARHGVAVVCVSHLNKAGGGDALMRVTGSLAFVAASRAAFVVVRDKEDANRRLFLPIKNNVGNDQTGLSFSLESCSLPGGIETSRVVWGSETVTITADEAICSEGEEGSALEDAKAFLVDALSHGPVSASVVQRDAEAAGHSRQTIRRAKAALGIKAQKLGMKEGWWWQLPAKMLKVEEGAHTETLSAFGSDEHLREEEKQGFRDGGSPPVAESTTIPHLTEEHFRAAGWEL